MQNALTETLDMNSSIAQPALEQAIDGIITIDDQNNVIFMNQAAERMWGYRANEVIGRNVKMLVPQEIQHQHDNFVNANRRTGVDKIVGTSRDIKVERRDGTTFWANLSLARNKIDGKTFYTAFVKDITSERQAQEIVRQTLEQAIDAVVTIDENNCVTFYNKAAEKLWGYEKKEVIGKNVKMLVPRVIQPQHDNLVNANRRTGVDKIVGKSREVEVYRKDGEMRWANLSLSKVELEDRTLYTAFLKDVTEEVNNREMFRLLSLVANETDNSVIITGTDGRIIYVNPGFTRLTGYESEEVIGKKPGAVLQGKNTDPETVKRISNHIKNREPFYEEILNYDKAGNSYWISLAINPVFNKEGDLEYFISIQANISTTKMLALETNILLDGIGESTAILEWDPKGNLMRSNSFFNDLLGCTRQEEVFEFVNNLGTFLSSEAYEEVQTGQATSMLLEVEGVENKKALIEAIVTPILDADKQLSKIVSYGPDISERRQMVANTRAAMTQILDRISDIVDSINKISVQTNLISINAKIESARAGEAGRAFAVVSNEVSELAQDAAVAAQKINDLIIGSKKLIEEL